MDGREGCQEHLVVRTGLPRVLVPAGWRTGGVSVHILESPDGGSVG